VIPGIDYANNLSRWLATKPRNPRHQLVAEAHVYGQQTCDAVRCFERPMRPSRAVSRLSSPKSEKA
jgi:hypothetical protein